MKSGLDSIAVVTLVALLLTMGTSQFHVEAENSYISDPGRVNSIITELDTPKIKPRESGDLYFKLSNPYEEVMEDVELNVSIYKFAYLGVEKNISEIEEPPVFTETSDVEYEMSLNSLESEEKIELEIRSQEGTEEGVYLLRFWLEFVYQEEEFVMKSRGYFSSDEFEEARISDDETYSDEDHTGGFDLDQLNVSGILPDSSFSVKSSLPRWPQYALGVISVLFAVLAVMFYFQEKYDMFPRLEKTFDNWSSKLEEFRRNFKERFDKS